MSKSFHVIQSIMDNYSSNDPSKNMFNYVTKEIIFIVPLTPFSAKLFHFVTSSSFPLALLRNFLLIGNFDRSIW